MSINRSQTALLQALIDGPGYGLDLMERVEEKTGGSVRLHAGSVYPALRALARDGLVESYRDSSAANKRGGRPRIYYRITGEGLRIAKEERESAALLFGLSPSTA